MTTAIEEIKKISIRAKLKEKLPYLTKRKKAIVNAVINACEAILHDQSKYRQENPDEWLLYIKKLAGKFTSSKPTYL